MLRIKEKTKKNVEEKSFVKVEVQRNTALDSKVQKESYIIIENIILLVGKITSIHHLYISYFIPSVMKKVGIFHGLLTDVYSVKFWRLTCKNTKVLKLVL